MSLDSKNRNNFLHIPRLLTNGRGFVVWKERLKLLIQARGLYGHLDGTTTRPDDPLTRLVGSKTLTVEEVSSVDTYTKELNQYLQEQAIVFQQIASTILDSLYLKIKGKSTVKEAWYALKTEFKSCSCMITIELQRQLYDIYCTKSGNICAHFYNIQTM